jgi:hypothetical protein
MELHIDYEKQTEYPLEQIEDPKAEVSFSVEKMKLSKDKSELRYNDFLLLRGIPAAAFDYRLGNRSALEWVIDQYRVSTDPRSGIASTTPTAPTTPNTSSTSSARSSPSPSKPSKSSPPFPPSTSPPKPKSPGITKATTPR